jgi:hypothetical protein
MEPYTLVMFGWITGSVIAGNPQFFDSKAACMAVKDRAEKQFESSLPSENYRVNALCKPTNRERSLKEISGQAGWDCFKYGKCGQHKPDAHIEVERVKYGSIDELWWRENHGGPGPFAVASCGV